jgi:hypothetical protein
MYSDAHILSRLLHFQRIILFYGARVNATSFMSIRNVPVFIKLINDQHHHLQISYTELHIYQAINVECTDRNIFTLPK